MLELNETLLHSASEFKDFYPENSQAEGASDNIWSDRETFNEYNQNFVDDIEMISLSIELEDKEMISDAIKAMSANCGALVIKNLEINYLILSVDYISILNI